VPPTVVRGVAFVAPFATLLALGCGGSPEELYDRGQASFKQGKLEPAVSDLESFVAKSCGPTGAHDHCRQAYLTLGHAYEKREAPGKAWAAYDSALTFGPHGADEPLESDRDRMRDLLGAQQQKETARAPIIIRYRDEVTEEYTPRSVIISLDFQPVVTKDKDVADLHSADFRRLYSASVSAGEHVLVIEMAHDCAPGGGAHCARSRVHKAWPFSAAAHTPSTIEIRAYAESGEGDNPSRPALELVTR
jgi:tetratricopeptide (TPR) repeat protein